MRRTPAFTLLEVALIVAIIGMMIAIIVGYLLAPKAKGPLPPIVATPVPFLATPAPTPVAPMLSTPAVHIPATTPTPSGATPVPDQTIDLTPKSPTLFR